MTTVVPPPSPPSRPTFDFVRPFTFVFDDPRWIPKILMGGLFTVASVFIVGAFFVYGYLARLVRNVIAGVPNPLPEWDELGEFFGEGAKLFCVALVYAIPIVLLIMLMVIPAAILSNNDDSDLSRNLGGGIVTCMWCLVFPISLAMAVWLPGALLMAIVTGQFSAAFDYRRIAAFIRANVGNYLLAFVVWLVARFGAGFGFLLLCVGVFFTLFWAFCVAAYAFAQTYRLSTVK